MAAGVLRAMPAVPRACAQQHSTVRHTSVFMPHLHPQQTAAAGMTSARCPAGATRAALAQLGTLLAGGSWQMTASHVRTPSLEPSCVRLLLWLAAGHARALLSCARWRRCFCCCLLAPPAGALQGTATATPARMDETLSQGSSATQQLQHQQAGVCKLARLLQAPAACALCAADLQHSCLAVACGVPKTV